MRIASEWSFAGDPNDVVYIILEEEPIRSGHGSSNVQEPQNIASHHIPVKYRCQQCFEEFDDLQQLECHVACQQLVSASSIDWAGKIDKLGETNVQLNECDLTGEYVQLLKYKM